MNRHAYLIIAHKNQNQLETLISLLDDYRNDIFILIDKKSNALDENRIMKVASKSKVFFPPRISITWGGYSQVEAELILFESARRITKYTYYHLISGQDLPLQSQDYIHSFFEKYNGYEFLTYVGEEIYKRERPIDRIKYYYPLIERSSNYFSGIRNKVQHRILIPAQKLLRVDRTKNMKNIIGYGSNWVSITDDFVKYILDHKSFIKQCFSNGFCVDELFIHTLAENSDFSKRVFIREGINDKRYDRQGNLRYINWWSGSPRIWRIDDKEELLEAIDRGYLFSRKFDESFDKSIIAFIKEKVINGKEKETTIKL